MRDPITARVAQILAQSQHILVPMADLYNSLVGEGLMSRIDLDMFIYLIASDGAFEILGGLEELEVFSPLLRAELEVQGFGSGPLVMLRRRATEPTLIIQDALIHLYEMNAALESAWKARPADDPEAEAELLQMLLMSDMLAREIEGALQVHAEAEDPMAPHTHDLESM
ncbi:MAG TPA: hypothetical protein PKZ84_23330 [Anaerolineae bacterium]|nr:hypothetical protein [Anaerolineae bacterium]HQI87504.1 hypothetical protein [Anaerolineae bacterium]